MDNYYLKYENYGALHNFSSLHFDYPLVNKHSY